MSSYNPPLRTAALLFPQADILDFAGPIEVFSHAHWSGTRDIPSPIFQVEIIGRQSDFPMATGRSQLPIAPTLDIDKAMEEIESFDILLMPGGPPDLVTAEIERPDGRILEFIKKFAELKPELGKLRYIQSVCTGALFLAESGILNGLSCTTHHKAFDRLEDIMEKRGEKAEILRNKRWVDGGVRGGVRTLTAGGVSSGIDAALHLVELINDKDTATYIATLMEYERRQL